jgi:hypothetical protein
MAEHGKENTLTTARTPTGLVDLIAQEIACGIDRALGYWLGRVEQELVASGLSPAERLRAIASLLQEYREVTGKYHSRCAQA